MRAKLARLQLKDYRYYKIRVDSNEEFFEAENIPEDLQFIPDIDIRGYNEENGEFVVFLDLLINDDNVENFQISPYWIEVEISGYFTLPELDEHEDSEAIELKYLNAPAILYGLCREKINELTSGYVFGPIILPSINLVETFKSSASGNQNGAQSTE